jgi:hypothetical protein
VVDGDGHRTGIDKRLAHWLTRKCGVASSMPPHLVVCAFNSGAGRMILIRPGR